MNRCLTKNEPKVPANFIDVARILAVVAADHTPIPFWHDRRCVPPLAEYFANSCSIHAIRKSTPPVAARRGSGSREELPSFWRA